MGMFDYIVCEYPLPGIEIKYLDITEFQTKDLDNNMDRYKIDGGGNLWIEQYDIEDRSDPSAEGIARIFGLMTRVNHRWERYMYTGHIEFYNTNICMGAYGHSFTRAGEDEEIVDYTAIFVNGWLTCISQTNYSVNPTLSSSDANSIIDTLQNGYTDFPEVIIKDNKNYWIQHWGDMPFKAKLVYTGEKALIFESKEGKITKIYPSNTKNILFNTKKDAIEYRKNRNSIDKKIKEKIQKEIQNKIDSSYVLDSRRD